MNILFKRQFAQEILPKLIERQVNSMFFLLGDCFFATTSFDLWMFKEAYDVFALMIIFLGP
jgi:hypothetical protein